MWVEVNLPKVNLKKCRLIYPKGVDLSLVNLATNLFTFFGGASSRLIVNPSGVNNLNDSLPSSSGGGHSKAQLTFKRRTNYLLTHPLTPLHGVISHSSRVTLSCSLPPYGGLGTTNLTPVGLLVQVKENKLKELYM